MSTNVIRVYETPVQAAKAAKDVMDSGFQFVSQFKGAGGKGAAAAANRNALVSGLMKAHVWQNHAELYADMLGKGGGLVAVNAPFGTAVTAANILDSHNPVRDEISNAPRTPGFQWDEATPLSSALRLPVLSDVKLPFELLLGVSSLTKGKAFLSNLFGMPLLSAGLSQRHSSMGMRLLSNSATPLSSALGLRTLSQNSTPLSSLLGLAVLKRG
jgi:hypothetical protein